MGALILIAAAALVYGWYSGKLKGFTYEDGIAAAVFLLGPASRAITGEVLMVDAGFHVVGF